MYNDSLKRHMRTKHPTDKSTEKKIYKKIGNKYTMDPGQSNLSQQSENDFQ